MVHRLEDVRKDVQRVWQHFANNVGIDVFETDVHVGMADRVGKLDSLRMRYVAEGRGKSIRMKDHSEDVEKSYERRKANANGHPGRDRALATVVYTEH